MVQGMSRDANRADAAEAGRLLALGSLVPGIVHELNNALLGLLGMLELAQADAAPAARDRLVIAQQAGEEIREVARVLGALAREPLDDRSAIEPRELAGEVVVAAAALNLVRGLEVVEVYAPESALVEASPAQLRHALLLLLCAGFAASGRQGPILVEVGPEDGRARVCVRHSGAGAGSEDGDAGLEHVAAWATEQGGELRRERTRVTLLLPLA
jgi:signal transduction histidine kinase